MATACNIKRGWSTTALVVCQYQRTTASLPAGCFGSSVIAHWRHFSGMQQPQHRPSRDNDWQLLIKTDTQQQRRIRRVSLIFSQRYLSSCPSICLWRTGTASEQRTFCKMNWRRQAPIWSGSAVKYSRRRWTDISLYFENDKTYGHSYNGRRTGLVSYRIRSIE